MIPLKKILLACLVLEIVRMSVILPQGESVSPFRELSENIPCGR